MTHVLNRVSIMTFGSMHCEHMPEINGGYLGTKNIMNQLPIMGWWYFEQIDFLVWLLIKGEELGLMLGVDYL